MNKRKQIMDRRRATDEYIASWFAYRPVSKPARTQVKILSRTKAALE